MKHLIIEYRISDNYLDIDRPLVASVRNIITDKIFYLASYSKIEKRNELAPKLLEYKIGNPSSEFKKFMELPIKDK
jgi:hypothetical protein